MLNTYLTLSNYILTQSYYVSCKKSNRLLGLLFINSSIVRKFESEHPVTWITGKLYIVFRAITAPFLILGLSLLVSVSTLLTAMTFKLELNLNPSLYINLFLVELSINFTISYIITDNQVLYPRENIAHSILVLMCYNSFI